MKTSIFTSFPITIKIGQCKTANDALSRLKKHNVIVSSDVESDIESNDDFTFFQSSKEKKLIMVSLKDLGFPRHKDCGYILGESTLSRLSRKRFGQKNLSLVHPEETIELAIKLSEMKVSLPEGLVLYIGMDPVRDKSSFLNRFFLTSSDEHREIILGCSYDSSSGRYSSPKDLMVLKIE